MEQSVAAAIMPRRLIIDGDGGGDDRKLSQLIKGFANWCAADETPEQCEASFQKLKTHVRQVEFFALRTLKTTQMYEAQQQKQRDVLEDVLKEIERVKEEVKTAKLLLKEATKHRKYSMEYDAMAKIIESQPDRKESEVQLAKLENELKTLKDKRNTLDDRILDRKKSIQVLISAVQKIDEVVKENELHEKMDSMKMLQYENMDVDSPGYVGSGTPTASTTPTPQTPGLSISGPQLDCTGLSTTPGSHFSIEKYDDLSESDTDV